MAGPIVDVLIPVFNAAPTLREAVASMTAQTVCDIRLVIVDDGSTDDSPALLAAMAAEDPRITVLRKENGGIVEALNFGLAQCTAEFIARFDSDDLAYPHRLERQLAYLRDHPDCVAVGCDVDHIDESGAPIHGLPRPGPPENADPTAIPAHEPYLIHPYLFARRAALVEAGGYRHVPASEDSDLYWRLSEVGRLHNLEERLGQYRMHGLSISGGSIVNGRVMAVGSQLGALSALRRRAGRPDLAFAPRAQAALKAGGTLEAMLAAASDGLEPDEVDRLALMASIKLLELAGYRPYEVEASDCAVIRSALPRLAAEPDAMRRQARWHLTHTAARLARAGKLKAALILAPPRYLPRVVALTLMKARRAG